jgi:uncharacterized protein YjbI with pentapeptide repeats
MAITEHVQLIKGGPKVWNAWRLCNSDIPDLSEARLCNEDLGRTELSLVDLHEANLSGANLVGANLRRANLREANLIGANLVWTDLREANLVRAHLSGANVSEAFLPNAHLRQAHAFQANFRKTILASADLSGADLREATLVQADLRGCNLRGADLTNADLTGADLSRTDLAEADLRGTNLTRARLTESDLSNAVVGFTILGDVDLSTVKGLITTQHLGPSVIGIDTLLASGGNIPDVFLRGVGLTEAFITYLPSLLAQPLEFYSSFISYSHANKAFAHRLHDALQNRGIRCWLDAHQLLPGDKLYSKVDSAIRLSDKVLLCCSKESLTSWWVDNEIKIAFDKEQKLWRDRQKEVLALIPLNLDEYLLSGAWQSGLATEVKSRLAANFIGWENDDKKFEEQFERLVKALRTSLGNEPPPRSLL